MPVPVTDDFRREVRRATRSWITDQDRVILPEHGYLINDLMVVGHYLLAVTDYERDTGHCSGRILDLHDGRILGTFTFSFPDLAYLDSIGGRLFLVNAADDEDLRFRELNLILGDKAETL